MFEVEALAKVSTPLRVGPGIVDVWAYSLSSEPPWRDWCCDRLDEAERERAARFIFPRDGDRHIIAHGILRHLLSRYCGRLAGDLRFTFGAAGKPALAPGSAGDADISFNLAHSGARALLAVSCGAAELGADLEEIRPDVETLAIARRYFFGGERDTIEASPTERQHDTFFRYWVAKEAVLKAQGVGLGFPLDQFHVEFGADETRARVRTFDAVRLAPDWTVQLLPMEAGWHGAVAARGEDWKIRLREGV